VSGYFDERNSIYLLYSGIGDQPGRSIVRRFGRDWTAANFPEYSADIFTANDSKRHCVVADSDWRFDRLRNLPPIRRATAPAVSQSIAFAYASLSGCQS